MYEYKYLNNFFIYICANNFVYIYRCELQQPVWIWTAQCAHCALETATKSVCFKMFKLLFNLNLYSTGCPNQSAFMINHSRCLSGAFKWFRGQWGTSSLHRGKYQESGIAPDNCPEHRTKYKEGTQSKLLRLGKHLESQMGSLRLAHIMLVEFARIDWQ